MNKQHIKALKGVSTGMVVLAILFAFLISGIRIFGIQVYGVLTGSMEPTYPTGSLIDVKSVNAQELRVNDVITFSLTPGVIATHRIVEVVQDENNPSILRFRTKGDANNDVDASLVSAGNIVGKVAFSVPGLGYLASYIQQPPGIYVAILVGGLMIAFVFYTDSLESKAGKQQKKAVQKQGGNWAVILNPISVKLFGKPFIRQKPVRKTPEDASFYSGYIPPRSSHSSAPYGQVNYPNQSAQQGYDYRQYPQQSDPRTYHPQSYQPQYPQQQTYPTYGSQQAYGQYQQTYSNQGYSQQYAPQQNAAPQYYVPQYQQGYAQQRPAQQTSQQPYQQPYASPYDQGQSYQQPAAQLQQYGDPYQQNRRRASPASQNKPR